MSLDAGLRRGRQRQHARARVLPKILLRAGKPQVIDQAHIAVEDCCG